MRRIQLVLVLCAILAGVYLALDAFWIEPASLILVDHDVVVPGKKNAVLRGLRVAVITDLHIGSNFIDEDKVRSVVSLTLGSKPDLILLLGDYVVGASRKFGGRHVPFETFAPLLKPLSAPLGVYAVLGNHDRWDNATAISKELGEVGIRDLENEAVEIRSGKRSFALVGIGDAFSNAADPDRALARVSDDEVALCFTHSPDVFHNLSPKCALTIAGHTHGGQVNLPFVGRPIVPSRFGQRYAAGIVIESGRTLFVSTGIGTSIIPVRFRVPPEVSIVHIGG